MSARQIQRLLLSTLLALSLLPAGGCIGFVNYLLWGYKGHTEPALYTGMAGKRVAVICISKSSSFDPSGTTGMLAREIGQFLHYNVRDIELVDPEEIADWIDNNDWLEIDYTEVGRGVNADLVLAVDLNAISFQDTSSLVKGRADITTYVYDLQQDSKLVFKQRMPEHEYPSNGPAAISARAFRPIYIRRLAKFVAEYFYEHDFTEPFGEDAAAQ